MSNMKFTKFSELVSEGILFLFLSIGLLAAASYIWWISKSFYKEIKSKYVLTSNLDVDGEETTQSIEGIGMKTFDDVSG